MSGDAERVELEARVYSRVGAGDPRVERIDPVSGRRLLVTDSEWRLLSLDRARASRREALATSTERTGGEAPDAAAVAGRGPARRRIGPVIATATVAIGAIAGLLWWSGRAELAAAGDPAMVSIVVPGVQGDIASVASRTSDDPPSEPRAMAVFRDPARSRGSFPGWLESTFPASRVAQIASPSGPIEGVGIYAATTPDLVACLVARLEASGMIWRCAPVDEVAARGMVLRAEIPARLGTGRDPDGDGISGDAAESVLLVVEWRTDGTFRIAREGS